MKAPVMKILLADNLPTALATRSAFLTSKGFQVFGASSPEEVDRILETEHVHLAVLDIRLMEDDDEKDLSGIWIAQRPEYAPLTFIMLTGFPTVESIKLALRKHLGRVPAFDYLSKREGLEALQEAIEAAFTEQVCINWELQIDIREDRILNLLSLVSHIYPNTPNGIILNRAMEFEDLLRQMFFDYQALRIERLVWQRDSLIAFQVIAFSKEKAPEAFLMVAGERQAAVREAQNHKMFHPGLAAGFATSLKANRESLHFGVNLYHLAGMTPEYVSTLEEKYSQESWGAFRDILENVLENALSPWNERREIPESAVTLDDLFRREILPPSGGWEAALEERLQVIQRRCSALDGFFVREHGTLNLWLGDRQIQLVDPLLALEEGFPLRLAVARVHSPGDLRGDNILCQGGNRLWVTDFTAAGLKPYLWNFQSLEAAFRYDWTKVETLGQILLMEEALTGNKFHGFSTPDYALIDAELHLPVRAIQTTRRYAQQMNGFREPAYHLGMFYLALDRILRWQPDLPLTDPELSRLTHCLLSAAVIAMKLRSWTTPAPHKPKLRIDLDRRQVFVNEIERQVIGDGLEILLLLYKKRPGIVSFEEIIQEVYGYKPDDNSRGVVRQAVTRLRAKIEPNKKEPVFILTVPGLGYRLNLDPD